jgi:hypothetical protein
MILMLSKRTHERKPVPSTCRMTTRDRIQHSFMTRTQAGRQVWHPHLSGKRGWTHTQAVKKGVIPSTEQEERMTENRLSPHQKDRHETLNPAGRQVSDFNLSKKTNMRPSIKAERQTIGPHPIRKTGMGPSPQREDRYETLTSARRRTWDPQPQQRDRK